MKRTLIFIFILLLSSNNFGQQKEIIYLNHDHNYSTTYSYSVSELSIKRDSTFILKTWSVNSKKEWRSYKEYKPVLIDTGKIIKKDKFTELQVYRNGDKTDINWIVQINKNRLFFLYPNERGKLKRETKYKRINKSQ